ncbi:MerR family transcriptional regulator [Amycolatopsis rubida]|uniref:DNA-binding transcriptional regulator, MerR family n=1 Tax=Amycolatopsis rubida TaxID=112413 RepID=A0A1I5ZVF5_9PSEU|nr:MerR family transcriptional regulator [Amycolatopsis rubida]SFQ60323.1 DNA-binding transcriptional regulator, MerR family [Amycolatopsis rubida]
MGYRVGEAAALAGVTVRTLHHYDEIGLLSPSGRTASGYRRYDGADLDRLQRILLYRELGFPLETIASVLAEPGTDASAHLKRQRELLVAQADRIERMVAAVDRLLEARAMGNALTPEEKFEVFGGFREPEGYAEEAVRRWGETPEWQRARLPETRQEWAEAERQRKDWVRRLVALAGEGVPADSPAAGQLAEEHRAMLSAAMGECGYEMQQRIADLYADEPAQLAFLVREDEQRPGIGAYVRDAVRANAVRQRA